MSSRHDGDDGKAGAGAAAAGVVPAVTLHEIPVVVPPIGACSEESWTSMEAYRAAWQDSIRNPSQFWLEQANVYLDWMVPPTVGLEGSFGNLSWFANAKLNVCYNAVDRHDPNKVAIVWEGDEPTDLRTVTFGQLRSKVSQIAHALLSKGVNKGDIVTIYMPMIPELPMTMLACARIGAVHSVVFAGFSADALASRVSAASSKIIVTADQGKRAGKTIPLKEIVDLARTKYHVETVLQHVLVWERFFDDGGAAAAKDAEATPLLPPTTYHMQNKDVRMDVLVANMGTYCPVTTMDAEDPLFTLYTSGSTGMPKGLLHTTGGYSLYAAYTTRHTFGLQNNDNDLLGCVADCGWITGHTYVVYGPLLNGCATFVFESTPVYPHPGRYWEMIERHKMTVFYTAPTAIRLLMKYGDDWPAKFDTSSVRVLGTVGEPINPEAWRWYYEVVGKKQATVVDTYWQTETGGHVVTNFPGLTPMKPGSCTLPGMGIDTVLLDPVSGRPVTEPNDETGRHYKGVLAIRQPWPGLARTCLGDHPRYCQVYLQPYPGYYFTGDSAMVDEDGYIFVIGRVDDVLNVSGHRIGTAEVESALVAHPAVAQAAVVGRPHDIKGQSIAAFCMLTDGYEESPELIKELKACVKNDIGSFASPDLIVICPTLPMTRSGKIMRRVLRKICAHEEDQLGDTSTLADPSIVDILVEKVAHLHHQPHHGKS